LPFDAMTLTFQDVRYCVPMQVRRTPSIRIILGIKA
jgi:hypothetical protein